MLRWLTAIGILVLAGCAKAPVAAYVDSRSCAGCHAAIAKTYSETAMARAFHSVRPGMVQTGKFLHGASGRTYEISERGGRYFQSRTENGLHSLEKEIHYVMGSGSHARTFIHRTPQGRLVELPLGWYAENGGMLAMSPGYDKAAPLDFRRKISFDCMFCHNAYPAIPAGQDKPSSEPVFPAELPEGIDCQRCHGPASLHLANGGKGGIVNPAKLTPERSMEVCMQCHLETTSRPLPNSLVRFERGAFSYRPGEPLSDFVLHFDHGPGKGREDKFEIVSSVYRLRQSRCFVASGGKLGCTTCHNPHDVPRGAAARVSYTKSCLGCHSGITGGPHTPSADCAGCHMPKRRTEDVVHAVMTDHKIMRRPPAGDLVAPLAERNEERFDGEVILYYPQSARDQELYLSVAQVAQKSNLPGGIARLEALPSRTPQAAYALAEAYGAEGNQAKAEFWYQEALARDAKFVPAMKRLGGVAQLEKARMMAPDDAGVMYSLGLAYREAGRRAEAVAALERAIQLDVDFPEAHNALGGLFFELQNKPRAEASLREALRHQPDFSEAHSNLGQLLAAAGEYGEAEKHLRLALRWKPGIVEVLRALAEVQSAQGAWSGARKSYEEVLRIRADDEAALLGLGTALAALGDFKEAKAQLGKAASAKNLAIRAEALALLEKL